MIKIIALGKKLVQKENMDSKLGLGARAWGKRAQAYAVVFKFWPNQDKTWGDMASILKGLEEFWHLWNMTETVYTLTKETPLGAKGLGQGYLHIFTDRAIKALDPIPTVSTPAPTAAELQSRGFGWKNTSAYAKKACTAAT